MIEPVGLLDDAPESGRGRRMTLCEMNSIPRDAAKIRALIDAIKEAKTAGYINPVLAGWVLEELKQGTG
jgi:hypothetical protein